jgi:hypothetical protein
LFIADTDPSYCNATATAPCNYYIGVFASCTSGCTSVFSIRASVQVRVFALVQLVSRVEWCLCARCCGEAWLVKQPAPTFWCPSVPPSFAPLLSFLFSCFLCVYVAPPGSTGWRWYPNHSVRGHRHRSEDLLRRGARGLLFPVWSSARVCACAALCV